MNQLTAAIIGSAIEVHRELGGPGLLEDIYEEALAYEIGMRNLAVRRQVSVPVLYKGRQVKKSLVIDLMVENQIIVEVKAVEKHNPIYEAQLLTYLRLTGLKLGLVINFGDRYVKDGIFRVVNGTIPTS